MAELSASLAPYTAVIASRIRAQRAYRASFAADLLGSLLIGFTELAEVWVIFHNIRVLGGLDFAAVLLVFGLSNVSFATADMLVGHMDRLPTFIRAGTLDAFYLRPQPVLAQLMTCEFSLRRLSRIAIGAVVVCIALIRNDIDWNVAAVLLLVSAVVGGTLIFTAVFVAAAAVQFFLINGSEFSNAFTYGGAYAAAQPASTFPTPLRLTFGFVVPVVFTGYLPTLALLGLPGPSLLPAWLAWWTPLAVLWVWAVALWLWRLGTRHYQGGGG